MVKYLEPYDGANEAIATMCPECGNYRATLDYEKDEFVCTQCGLMWANGPATKALRDTSEQIVDMKKEWAYQIKFQRERTKNSKRGHIGMVKQAVDALLEYGVRVEFCDRLYQDKILGEMIKEMNKAET